MKPFQKLALTLFVAALFAVNGHALTCSGTLIVQLPAGWATSTHLAGGGNFQSITGTTSNGWTTFNITQAMLGQYQTSFVLTNQNGNYNAPVIAQNAFNSSTVNNGTAFTCAQLTAASNNTLYISEHPTIPGTTVFADTPPNAYHFYFLPPTDPEWTLGTPYLVWFDGTLHKEELGLDASRCGWFKRTWFNSTPPNVITLVWLNGGGTAGTPDGTPDDQLGILGFDEDPLDWDPEQGMPTPFNLVEQFQTVVGGPGDLFFIPKLGQNGWRTTDLGEVGECSYNFAAIIYDTDATVNSSFFDGGEGVGVVKGIPAQTLTANADGIMKMTWGNPSGNADGWTQQNFIDAFKPTTGKNIVRCYDMPFERNKESLWEFNSNKLCLNGTMDLGGTCAGRGGYMGGYFPPELQIRGDAAQDYATNCPTCDTKRKAQGWVPLNNSISQYCYDRARTGTGTNCTTTELGTAGDFRSGDAPAKTAFWDWGSRSHDDIPARPAPYSAPLGQANELFCFESTPAEFTYKPGTANRPGQEFFFSGDDDIWVFINNRRVIDLGGTHLAAPGYVNLDAQAASLGLEANKKYPINIFFCDRRTTMSNVRITTNMYFASKNSLSVDGNATGSAGAQVCLDRSGSAGTCADVKNGGSTVTGTECGEKMGNILDYYMQNRQGDSTGFSLDPNNPMCNQVGNNLVCFGGIILENYYTNPVGAVSRVKVDYSKTTGLMGTYRLYAKINDANKASFPNAAPLFITTVRAEGVEQQIWGKVVDEDGKLIFNLGPKNKKTVSGQRVPVGFSVGDWDCTDDARKGNEDCPFRVSTWEASALGALGAQVGIPSVTTNPGGRSSDLLWYKTEFGGEPVAKPSGGIVPANPAEAAAFGDSKAGLLVYWVTGEYEAADDQTHTIGKELGVEVVLPRLAFVDPGTRTRLAVPGQTQGSEYPLPAGGFRAADIMIGEPTDRAIAAYGAVCGNNYSNFCPTDVCKTCNFDLRLNAWLTVDGVRTSTVSSAIMQSLKNPTKVEEGYADFEISGRMAVPGESNGLDSLAFFTMGIQGSQATRDDILAKWDNLIFTAPPVPYPTSIAIYDVSGDGIGDSLHIVYNRKFPQVGSIRDSLPSMIEIAWAPDTVFRFGPGKKNPNDDTKWTTSGNPQADYEFWTNGSVGDFRMRMPNDSTIVIYGDSLSKKIQTAAVATSEITNWATYISPKSGSGVPADFGTRFGIEDRIPAIVVKATYDGDDRKCGTGPTSKCTDIVTVVVSEPIKLIEGIISPEKLLTPFAYKMPGRGVPDWTRFDEQINLPTIRRSSDSIFYLTYQSYSTDYESTRTPVAGDSVRFVWVGLNAGDVPYTDLMDNLPNPNEIGKRIEGTNRFNVEEVRIAEVDPDKDILKDALKDVFKDHPTVNPDTLFTEKKQVTLLPGNDTWDTDSIRYYFPGSVGQLLMPDVENIINGIEMENGLPEGTIKAKDIVFHAKSYYHTNLGTFVAQSPKIEISCDDPIFTIFNDADCRSKSGTPKGIYLAWNLKDAKNRWVGAGAYVEVYDFYWQVTYEVAGRKYTKTFDKIEKRVEMLGVKRAKKK